MRRIKLVLGALAVVVATFAAFAGPAMADTQRCNVHDNNFVNCNGDRFVNPDNFFFNNNGGLFFTNDFFPFFNFPGFGAFDNVNGFDGVHNVVFQEAE